MNPRTEIDKYVLGFFTIKGSGFIEIFSEWYNHSKNHSSTTSIGYEATGGSIHINLYYMWLK